MNEVDLILEQIRIEREHVGEVLAAGRAAARELDRASDAYWNFSAGCLSYLKFAEARVRARVAGHGKRLHEVQRRPGSSAESSHSMSGTLAELEELESHLSRQSPPEDYLGFNIDRLTSYSDKLMLYMRLSATLDALAAGVYAVADWRAVAQIDADGMLEERRRYDALMSHPLIRSPEPT